jgi:hypothetical protein
VVFSFDGEIFSHHLKGNVAAHIEPEVVAAAEVGHAADHFEAQAIDQDERADRGAAREQRLLQFVAEDNDIAALQAVQFIEPAAFFQGQVTDLVEIRIGAQDFAAASGEFADLVQIVAGDDGAGIADEAGVSDVAVILIGEQVGAGRIHVALDGGSAAREQEHDVFAELGQFALIAGAEALAYPNQEQQRSHAPGNAEHGEERAQLVRPQVADDLREDVEYGSHDQLTLLAFAGSSEFLRELAESLARSAFKLLSAGNAKESRGDR